MRGLKHLIPDNVRDSLNASPAFRWAVILLFIALGLFLTVKGVRGVLHQRITDKRGRVYEGTSAQVLGVIYAILGVVFVLVPFLISVGSP